MSFTIDRMPIPESLDGPGGADFVEMVTVRNQIEADAGSRAHRVGATGVVQRALRAAGHGARRAPAGHPLLKEHRGHRLRMLDVNEEIGFVPFVYEAVWEKRV